MASSKEVIAFQPKTKTDECNVFVFSVDGDEHIKNEIVSVFKSSYIAYYDVDDYGLAGRSIYDSIEHFLCRSSKALVIVPALMKRETKLLIENIVSYQIPVIVFIPGGCNTRLLCLSRFPTVKEDSGRWQDTLISEVQERIPDFCEIVCKRNLSDDLHLRGLCFDIFCCDIYGVFIHFRDKYLQIDLEQFAVHFNVHSQIDISAACGKCRLLRSLDTRVTVILPLQSFSLETKSKYLQYIPALLSQVFDVNALAQTKEFRHFVFSLNGTIKAGQLEYIRDLHQISRNEIRKIWQQNFQQPLYPDYTDVEKRIETFVGNWDESVNPSSIDMAAAGYVCVRFNTARCFSCGNGFLTYPKDKDPAIGHRKFKQCEYIKNTDVEKKEDCCDLNTDQFENVLQRKKSFTNFDFSLLDTTKSEGKLVEELAESGFYHSGPSNFIQCFNCNVGIFYHMGRTSPWDLHAIASPTCGHLTTSNTQKLIQSVSAEREDQPTVLTFFLQSKMYSRTDNVRYTYTY